ncbi:MAG: DUF1501 domain-containing protein [Planctomycetaceae bacterium]
MLTMLGSPRRCCDGFTRRETLRAGALSALGGFGLPQMLQAEQSGLSKDAKAKNVIFIFLLGGAATQDMYDLKPNAPAEVRGEFKPIPTTVPGIDVCEHLPKFAQMAHQFAFIRSVNHKAGCHNCLPCYTGFDVIPPDQHPRPTDAPSIGSVLQYMSGERTETPQYVYMPNWLGWGQSFRRAGPYGGFLGKQYDALTTECMPFYDKDSFAPSPGTPQIVRGAPVLPSTSLEDGMTIDRLNIRRSLLSQIDTERRRMDEVVSVSSSSYQRNQRQAFDILTSSAMRQAFDLSQEDPKMVDRYGQTLFGNSTLIARRLIEAGVRFVNVTWDLFWGPVNVDYDAWDTHNNNFNILKKNKLPGFDQTMHALMTDLQERGLLDETLIVVTSEMGRTPRINANSGRDHWTNCYGSLLAGAGIRGGTVYGASDNQAGYVADNPVRPADLLATIYRTLGIDPATRVPDQTGRPIEIAQGGHEIFDVMTA